MHTKKHIHNFVRMHAPTAAVALCGFAMGLFIQSIPSGLMKNWSMIPTEKRLEQRMARYIEPPLFTANIVSPTDIDLPLPMITLMPDPVPSLSSSSISVPALIEKNPIRIEHKSQSSAASASLSSSAPIQVPASEPIDEAFPAFGRTVHPVNRVPNWGAMRTPAEWNRQYSQLTDADFVPVPRYDLAMLTIPMAGLVSPLTDDNIPIITAKLYYSTRYMGSYDLDAGEYTGTHAGVDLKLAEGTPVGTIAGGRVQAVASDDILGIYVVVEHHPEAGKAFFSIYGHLGSASVKTGDALKPGQTVGYVGMTGMTTAPHLHLEVNAGFAESMNGLHGAAPAGGASVNPITFIVTNGGTGK